MAPNDILKLNDVIKRINSNYCW